jgi:dTDP-4-dehydrorhamnose reductase
VFRVRVLITGACGQVGSALIAEAPHDVEIRALTRSEMDIGDASDVRAAVAVFRPTVIINAAAYTAVDKAEFEADIAENANARGPRNLALAALMIPGCRLLHISTGSVFDGRAASAYKPHDLTNPMSVYGRTKLRGEQAVIEILHERAAVLRTAWLYSPRGKNFLMTTLRLMRERPQIRIVADQLGTPTTAQSVAGALWAIARRPDVHGLVHWSDAGSASWYEFAVAIAEEAHTAGLLSGRVQVTPIATHEYPTPAHRLANSLLDCRDLIETLKMSPKPWRDNLRAVLAQVP